MSENQNFTIPHDPLLESQIIGSFFYDPETLYEVRQFLQPEWFYMDKNRKIAKETFRLFDEDIAKVNFVEMLPFLEREQIPLDYLMNMTYQIASASGIDFHAYRLKALALLRMTVKMGLELFRASHLREAEEIFETIQQFSDRLQQISENAIHTETMVHIEVLVKEYDKTFMQLLENPAAFQGLKTGFKAFDKLTGGLQKDDLIILGARPSMGKTAWVVQVANNVGIEQNLPTALFSIEMSDMKILQRMISQRAKISLTKLNQAALTIDEFDRHEKSLSEIRKGNLFIDDESFLTVSQIKAKAAKIKRQHGLSLILIDYLGLILSSDSHQSRYEQVSMNTRQLKALAKALNVPVVVLSQLSREVETRKDKRPVLSDLRESGEIEQAADIVAFLYRDSYYNPKKDDNRTTELILAKHRNGPTGKVYLDFYKEINKFYDR